MVAVGPKPNAVGAVVLAPNEPNENPDVSSQQKKNKEKGYECKVSLQLSTMNFTSRRLS